MPTYDKKLERMLISTTPTQLQYGATARRYRTDLQASQQAGLNASGLQGILELRSKRKVNRSMFWITALCMS